MPSSLSRIDVAAARPEAERAAKRTPVLSTRTISERAGGGRNDREIVEAAAGLRARVALHQLAGVRVHRRLAGQEDQPAALDRVGVGTGRGGRADRGDRFAMMGHGKGTYT